MSVNGTIEPPRLYYGWVVVAVAFLTMAIAMSARSAFSLLYPELIDEFGWDRGITAGAFSVGFVASTALIPIVGVLMDRIGPHGIIPLGGLMVAIGFIAAPSISSPLSLYVFLGVFVVCGSMATTYITHSMFLPNWFVRRRGLAIGVAFSGVGIGAITLMPLTQAVIDAHGWRNACYFLAAVILCVMVPINFLFQRRAPEDMGLEPDGGAAGAGRSKAPAMEIVDKAWAETEWTLPKALRTARFWWIAAAYFAALFAWYAILVHQTKFLIEIGFDPVFAATALGLVGLCGIAGQIGVGWLSDRTGREFAWTIALSGYVTCYALLLMLEQMPLTILVYLMVGLQGLLGYGLASLFGPIPAELYGGRRFATIFGIISLIASVGGAAGPYVLGVVFDRTGSYSFGFAICLVLSAASILCMWIAAPRKVRRRVRSGQAVSAASRRSRS